MLMTFSPTVFWTMLAQAILHLFKVIADRAGFDLSKSAEVYVCRNVMSLLFLLSLEHNNIL